MTIPNTARKAGPLLGTGSQTAWPFTFKVFAAGDVQVTIANSAGTETLLVLGTDYTVTLNSNQDTSPGGTVNYPISGAALPVGSVLAIIGDLDYDQPLDLPSGGNFSPTALENQLDRSTMQIQQLREEMNRTAKLPPTSSESVEELVDDLQRIADSADNLDTVAGNIASVNTVAADLNEPVSEINTVAGAIANVNTVGTNIANVNTVAGISANVTTVAGISANVTTVASIAANVTTVAGVSAAVTAVAAIDDDVTIAAANVADITNFADVYQGPKTSDPTLRNNGSALQVGDLYFNTVEQALRTYGGTQWVAGTAGTMAVQNFSGNGSTTAFTLAAAPASENNTQVYVGGVYQQKDTYSVSGATLTFSAAPPSGTNNIEVVTISTLALGETDATLVTYQPAGTGSTPTNVQARMRDHDGTTPLLRKPRKLFSKLFAAASGPSRLKTVVLGDSLSAVKLQQLTQSLDRRFGGTASGGVNTAGNSAGGLYGTGGIDCNLSTNSGCVAETGKYEYWPTGQVLRMDAGASAAWTIGGVNPTFTDIKVYYVKESGAGTINLVVGGSTVATASANASASLGVLSYIKAFGQASVSLTTSGASVRVLFVHASTSSISGVDVYASMAVGGLLLANATASAQGRAIWQAALADIAPDFITFEMDDAFGDGGANAAAFTLLSGMLDAACPNADKLIIASTPRASDDAGKLAARDFLLNFCAGKDASYLFFDSYYLMGTYAQMNAIFGTDDGTHPTAAASAYAAEVMWNFLGLNGFNLGYVSRAVNDPGTPSRLARNSVFQGPGGDRNADFTVETDASFGYDWTVKFPRTLVFGTRGSYGSVNGTVWQFSGNTAVFPNVMPLNVDFNSSGNVRKLTTGTGSGYEFLQYKKTDNPTGFMHMETGLIRANFTRAQLLAIGANQVLGAIAFCTDCTGGAQLVYARGGSPTDWVTVDGKTAI